MRRHRREPGNRPRDRAGVRCAGGRFAAGRAQPGRPGCGAGPDHRGRPAGGVILFLSSIDSLYAAPGGEGVYGACKAALNNITQTMAVELGQYRIRVNAIAPAVVETPLTAPWLATEEDRRSRAAFYPLR